MPTILHISDIHRSSEEPVDNGSLLASLLGDSDRYIKETPAVAAPDALVVSGDLIQGAKLGDPSWSESIVKQYEVAEDFLLSLTERFLQGNRANVVLVPGNHDVCWNTAFAAMQKVAEADYPEDVRSALLRQDSQLRWNWRDRSLYKIVDTATYEKRKEAYWQFVERFYRGINLRWPISRDRGYQMFELFGGRAAIAAFDSTFANDCYCYVGHIRRQDIAASSLELRDCGNNYALKMAVWHHSIQGPPAHDDYMDVSLVHQMAGLGYQLGLHGHQHISSTATHYVHLNQRQAMAIVSAGSLCAGARELPRGINRQYNVISLSNDLNSARVHVREMVEGEQFRRKLGGEFAEGFVPVTWQLPEDLVGRAVDFDEKESTASVLKAEELLNSGDASGALEVLERLPAERLQSGHARQIAVQACVRLERWPKLSQIVNRPLSISEAVYLVIALTRSKQLDEARAALNTHSEIPSEVRLSLADEIEKMRFGGKR